MDFAITLDAELDRPLHQQLYDALREAILTGRLLPGQRLPSTRSLARSLKISRTTVTQSYEQLLSEGYLETSVGSGTYVCKQLPDDLLRSTPVALAPQQLRSSVKLSRYGISLHQSEFFLLSDVSLPISFRFGRPALSEFPIPLWRKLLSRHCRDEVAWLDYSADFQGYRPLRDAIARYISRARAVRCIPDQIVITNGTQQALDLILRLLIEPGEAIAMEEPGYLSARRIFLSHGAKVIPVPVDEWGLEVDRLAKLSGADIRLVYITPSHQFPTGAPLSLPRRLELLSWAQQTEALILEDDYDSEYRYGERPIPALQGLDYSDSVLYIGTFSKVLFPSLRIGYLVLPLPLVSLFSRAKWLSDRHLPLLEQKVLTDFIEEGHLESHIRRMRSHYDYHRQVLVDSLKEYFQDNITILGEQAGIHIMVKLNSPLSDAEIIQRAAQQGVGIFSAAPHYIKPQNQGEFIFGYGELNEAQIREGVRHLALSLKDAFH